MRTKTKLILITLLTLTTLTTPAQAWDPWNIAYIQNLTANPPTPQEAGTNITLTATPYHDTYLDQQATGYNPQAGFNAHGQTFIPQADTVKEIALKMWKLHMPGDATVSLWDGLREDPDSTKLGNVTLYITQNTEYTFSFPEAIPVTPGETYIFYIDSDFGIFAMGWYFHSSSTLDYYPQGELILSNPDFHGDMVFKINAMKDLEYSFSLDNKTTWTPWSASNTYQWNTTLLDIGNHSIYAKINDITAGGMISEIWMPLTYELTPPPIESIIPLIEQQIDHKGIANSLIVKLRNAQKAIEKDHPHTADNIINAYINELEAQTGKHIPTELAQSLILVAQYWLN